MRAGGHYIDLERRERRRREPPLVVLCDISGSCSNYSRMFLHFLHALTNDRDRVSVFLFGTRLTNKHSEIDVFVTGYCEQTKQYEAKRCTDFAVVYIGRFWSKTYQLKLEEKAS